MRRLESGWRVCNGSAPSNNSITFLGRMSARALLVNAITRGLRGTWSGLKQGSTHTVPRASGGGACQPARVSDRAKILLYVGPFALPSLHEVIFPPHLTEAYERYYVPASGRLVWSGPLANFTPGHQDTYVNFRNEDRAPLLFIAGGEDNLMPPAVNQSNVKHYRHAKSITDYKEFEGRSHYTVGQEGWEEVADYALEWAQEHTTTRPAA
jgi:pimeloyl-ACP methyl ester carboxylesterase